MVEEEDAGAAEEEEEEPSRLTASAKGALKAKQSSKVVAALQQRLGKKPAGAPGELIVLRLLPSLWQLVAHEGQGSFRPGTPCGARL